MKAVFADAAGADRPFVMGCYGIGVSRVVAAAVEQCHDAQGILWPTAIAPFQVHIVPINYEDAATREAADRLYDELTRSGYDVLLDDRPLRTGVKFKDADLIGAPVRVTVSDKRLVQKTAGFKLRTDEKERDCALDALAKEIDAALKGDADEPG